LANVELPISFSQTESKYEIKRCLEEEKLGMEWVQYMRCNGLPNASDPSDLRKYIHMWIEDFKSVSRREINWLLRVNEQSILTQDQAVVDMSRANLKKLQPDVGEMYARRATEVLGILDEMDAVIRDQYSLSPSKLDDLLDVSERMGIFFRPSINTSPLLTAQAGNPLNAGDLHRRVHLQDTQQYRAQHEPQRPQSSDVQVRVDRVQNGALHAARYPTASASVCLTIGF
jgi:hypothetical protein